jgi:hypothetical protein
VGRGWSLTSSTPCRTFITGRLKIRKFVSSIDQFSKKILTDLNLAKIQTDVSVSAFREGQQKETFCSFGCSIRFP